VSALIDTPTDEQGLAVDLRLRAMAATNELRQRDSLKPFIFEGWDDLSIDAKEGWRAARYVLAHYAFRDFDPEALVREATNEVHQIAGMLLDRGDCERVARAMLTVARLINPNARPSEAAAAGGAR
jgi:hypothetical protein